MILRPECGRVAVTRRTFLQSIGSTCVRRYRPLAAAFTAIADDLIWLMRWCCFDGGLRFAGAG